LKGFADSAQCSILSTAKSIGAILAQRPSSAWQAREPAHDASLASREEDVR